MVKLLWFLRKLNSLLSYDPITELFGIYPKELKTMSTQSIISALFVIAKTWKEPRHLSVREWINCGISRQWNIACMGVCSVTSVMSDSATLWTIAPQTPLSMGFSRQEDWSGLPSPPPPGDLSDPGIKPTSPALQADSLPTEHHLGSPNVILFSAKRNELSKP